MRLTNEIATSWLNEAQEDEPPRSEVLLAAKPTGTIVPGALLEATVEWEKHFVLFMTDDCPFEEMLHVHLLDPQLQLVDSLRLGSAYSTGTLSSIELLEPNRVRFRFIGDTDWIIELLEKPKLKLPFVSDPPGVHRAIGLMRRLVITSRPQPANG